MPRRMRPGAGAHHHARSRLMPVIGVLPGHPHAVPRWPRRREQPARMVERMLPSVDGYTLAGSTGESPSMTLDERLGLIELALGFTPSDKTVIVGINHTCQADAIRLAQHAQRLGAAGCCAPLRTTTRVGRRGAALPRGDRSRARDRSRALRQPGRPRSSLLGAPTVVEWAAQLEHLRSVKLTDHDLSKVAAWQAAGLSVLAGDDGILFRYLAEGVDGVMVIAPIVFPESFADVLATGTRRRPRGRATGLRRTRSSRSCTCSAWATRSPRRRRCWQTSG